MLSFIFYFLTLHTVLFIDMQLSTTLNVTKCTNATKSLDTQLRIPLKTEDICLCTVTLCQSLTSNDH